MNGAAVKASVRSLDPRDLRAIEAIERTVYSTPWREEHFARLAGLSGAIGLVVTVPPGEIVGYAIGWIAADEAELANIAVISEWRERGLGSSLLQTFQREAACRGARRLYLDVRLSNERAQSFYRRHGYEVVGRRRDYYHLPSEDGLVMALRLAEDSPQVDSRAPRGPVDPSGSGA